MWYVGNNLFFNEPPYPHMKTFEIVQALKLKLIEALLQGHVFLGMVLLSCVSYFHIGSTFQIGLIWFDIGKTKSHLIPDENSYLYFSLFS